MKKILFCLVALLLVVQGFAHAAKPKSNEEDEMKKQAEELSYMGQLDKANELLGEKTNLASGKAEDGWDTTSMVLGLLWGSIGTGYFIYGKKQARLVFLLCGIGLCVFPLFVSGNTLNLVLGLAMTIAPFKIDF